MGRYSEKTTKFKKYSNLFDGFKDNVEKIRRFFQNFVAFSEYLNFNATSGASKTCYNWTS